jgi:sec-independent protein translocase protein TatB
VFGMSWSEIVIILAVGMFVLGPERIPVAVKWVGSTLRTVRTMAAGAQEQLRGEFGPELEELRRQVADLQSLKEIQELRSLRDLNPRSMIQKNLLGEEFSGGMAGFLGLNQSGEQATGSGVAPTPEPVPEQLAVPDPAPLETADATPPEPAPALLTEPDRAAPAIPNVVINEPASLTLTKGTPRHAAAVSFDDDAT